MAYWIVRRYQSTALRLHDVETQLKRCPVDLQDLESEWSAQVREQTKPLARESFDSTKRTSGMLTYLFRILR